MGNAYVATLIIQDKFSIGRTPLLEILLWVARFSLGKRSDSHAVHGAIVTVGREGPNGWKERGPGTRPSERLGFPAGGGNYSSVFEIRKCIKECENDWKRKALTYKILVCPLL